MKHRGDQAARGGTGRRRFSAGVAVFLVRRRVINVIAAQVR
jgi:hypothetical protein